MSEVIELKISDNDLVDLFDILSYIPIQVQIRNYLNKKGFKFVDDGKLSSAINTKPKLIGVFDIGYSLEKKETTYRQVI